MADYRRAAERKARTAQSGSQDAESSFSEPSPAFDSQATTETIEAIFAKIDLNLDLAERQTQRLLEGRA